MTSQRLIKRQKNFLLNILLSRTRRYGRRSYGRGNVAGGPMCPWSTGIRRSCHWMPWRSGSPGGTVCVRWLSPIWMGCTISYGARSFCCYSVTRRAIFSTPGGTRTSPGPPGRTGWSRGPAAANATGHQRDQRNLVTQIPSSLWGGALLRGTCQLGLLRRIGLSARWRHRRRGLPVRHGGACERSHSGHGGGRSRCHFSATEAERCLRPAVQAYHTNCHIIETVPTAMCLLDESLPW